jgi:branched-chain amino acid transport system ATP-binding protein
MRLPASIWAVTVPSRDLTARGLHAYYGSAHVLFDIDVDVAGGSTLAVLGRNGAGKTTLLRSLANAGVTTRGDVRFGDKPLTECSPFEVARIGIQLVPEDRRIFTSLSVRDNLRLTTAAAADRRGPLPTDRVVELFPLLDRLLDRPGFALSGGEQQLVAIARAMVGNPELLLLDEPAEGLAPIVVEQVGEAIRTLQREFDLTVVIAEQNTTFALALSDRVCLLDGGRVVYVGPAAEFAAADDLKRTYLAV